MKVRKQLYGISRKINKIASILGDIEALASCNPLKITKRFSNKTKGKIIYRTANKINKKILKK